MACCTNKTINSKYHLKGDGFLCESLLLSSSESVSDGSDTSSLSDILFEETKTVLQNDAISKSDKHLAL